jgi:hypothetical protein
MRPTIVNAYFKQSNRFFICSRPLLAMLVEPPDHHQNPQ